MATVHQLESADAENRKSALRAAERCETNMCIRTRGWGNYCGCFCKRCFQQSVAVRYGTDDFGNRVATVRKVMGRCVCTACPCWREDLSWH